MQYEGVLTKMMTEFGDPIQYYLVFGDSFLHVNQLLGREIEILNLGTQCLNCEKKKRVFRQGYCYDCFMQSASAGDWIMRPELSKAHLGIADRDLDYETRSQIQPHIVYLASSCEVKVGVTRKSQVPTRWIDQGACAAIPAVEVPNRYLAGIAEVALKAHYTDKINWRKMLLNEVSECDFCAEKQTLRERLPAEVREHFSDDMPEVIKLVYPVLEYPKKVAGVSLDKTPWFKGRLCGVKGQYLIFEDGSVFNVRAAEGIIARFSV